MSPSTHRRLFWRQVFRVNHLHWDWNLVRSTKRQNTNKEIMQHKKWP